MAASRHECSICMDSFKNPKLISCHHSFCYKCLEDYVQVNLHNGCFNCPICRTSVHLPESGISGFTSNFYIDTDSNEKFPCEICGPKNVASSRCLDCEENLCQSCCYVHEKSKVSRHHKISDLVTLDPEMKGKIRQRVFCDQHPEEEIKLVCQDCNVTICFMCKVVKHDTHPTKLLADVAAEVKMTLDTKLNQCSDKLRRIKASTVKGDELDRSINDAEQQELKAVDDQCLQLHQAIDQEAAKFKDKIKNVYRLLKEQSAVFKRYMEEEFKSCSNTNDIAQNLRDQGTDIELIKKGPDIEQLISAAIVKTIPTPTIRVNSKLFSPAKIIASKLTPLIGILQDSTDAEEISRKEREERERKEREEREKQDREDRERKEREEREKKEKEEREKKEREERQMKEWSQKMETRVKDLEGELSSTKKQYEEAKANAITIGAKLNQAEKEIQALRIQHADADAEVNRYKRVIEEREKKEKEEREKKEKEEREKKEKAEREKKDREDREKKEREERERKEREEREKKERNERERKEREEREKKERLEKEKTERFHWTPLSSLMKSKDFEVTRRSETLRLVDMGKEDKYGSTMQKFQLGQELAIKIYKGSLVEKTHLDALITSINTKGEKGQLGKLVADSGGITYQRSFDDEMRKKYLMTPGDIFKCKSGNINVGCIINVVIDRLQSVMGSELDKYQHIIQTLFKNINDLKDVKTIAMPLLGSDNLVFFHSGDDLDRCCSGFVQAVFDFCNDCKKPNIKKIHIVNTDENVCKSVEKAFRNASVKFQ